MDPQDAGPLGNRLAANGSRAPKAGLGAGLIEHIANKALARGPDQHRVTLSHQQLQLTQQLQVLGRGFGKAQARIPDHLTCSHPSRQGLVGGFQQGISHLQGHVGVGGQPIHRLAAAAAVHQHIGAAACRHHRDHGLIGHAAHIVDPIGTGGQGPFGHSRVEGIDGEQGLGMGLASGDKDRT